MRYKLSDICQYVKGKVDVSLLNNQSYITTENMLPYKGGVTLAAKLPLETSTQVYRRADVLVSNIRPYFKKIWFATCDGGCSNDVLVFRAKKGVLPEFLYYVLSDDRFFEYSILTSKGTKMPRGDKKALMKFEVPVINPALQKKVVLILGSLDKQIETNKRINKNLTA